MRQDDDDGDSFFLELERAAKSLSIGADRSSADELRRLCRELQDDSHDRIRSILPEEDTTEA